MEISEIGEYKTIQKINKTRSWFHEQFNKIDKPLARLTQEIREKIQVHEIRNERGDIAMDLTEIGRIVRKNYKILHANKVDNLDEMDKLLETGKLLKLIQEEIENLAGSMTRKEIELVIKKLPPEKSPGPNCFTGEFYQMFKEELIHQSLTNSSKN